MVFVSIETTLSTTHLSSISEDTVHFETYPSRTEPTLLLSTFDSVHLREDLSSKQQLEVNTAPQA